MSNLIDKQFLITFIKNTAKQAQDRREAIVSKPLTKDFDTDLENLRMETTYIGVVTALQTLQVFIEQGMFDAKGEVES